MDGEGTLFLVLSPEILVFSTLLLFFLSTMLQKKIFDICISPSFRFSKPLSFFHSSPLTIQLVEILMKFIRIKIYYFIDFLFLCLHCLVASASNFFPHSHPAYSFDV